MVPFLEVPMSCDSPNDRLPQNFVDASRSSMKTDPNFQWNHRSHKCAIHLTAAMAQFVSSQRTFTATRSPLLPVVGYYYSAFHLSIALCFIHYAVDPAHLSMLHHTKLEKLFESNFVNRKILPAFWLKNVRALRSRRETACYPFDADSYEPSELTMKQWVEKAPRTMRRMWRLAVHYIHELDRRCYSHYPLLSRISVGIGDSFGDDVLGTYLSQDDFHSAIDQLVNYRLST